MDDRSDSSREDGLEPATVRTAVPALRREPYFEAPLTSPVTGQRSEPALSSPDVRPEPFAASPAAQASPGFIAPGTGLTPLSVRPAPFAATRAFQPASAPPAVFSPRLGGLVRKAARIALLLCAAWAVLVAGLILLYRFLDPPVSALMLQRALWGQSAKQIWVPLDAISPGLVRAVLVSEDGRFCQHAGIDLDAIQDAIERSGDGTPRGASTISMQVVKNLFLWPGKSYVRKALEVPLTLAIEAVWPKRRIMEVYLNVAEWGPGVYGAEAAARYHFSKPARRLTDREAAQLAVTLPNPIRRDAGDPGPGTRRLAGLIHARANGASRAQTACVLPARKPE